MRMKIKITSIICAHGEVFNAFSIFLIALSKNIAKKNANNEKSKDNTRLKESAADGYLYPFLLGRI